MLDIVIEYGAYVVLGIGMVCANLLGKPKTAEAIEKAKIKQLQKLKKSAKASEKALKLIAKVDNQSAQIKQSIEKRRVNSMAIQTANQGALNISANPVGNADRGIFGQVFTPNAIAREDWQRNEQAQNNQLSRDLFMQGIMNEFNALEAQKTREYNAFEAQKTRDFEERMSSTAYQRVMEDMKKLD